MAKVLDSRKQQTLNDADPDNRVYLALKLLRLSYSETNPISRRFRCSPDGPAYEV